MNMKISEFKLNDEVNYCTDKFGRPDDTAMHLYEQFYDEYFINRQNDKIKILEVGIGYGGSVRLFHDYLPNALIYCVDIRNDWNGRDIDEFSRINFKQSDGYNNNLLELFGVDGFDLIIDDGPHTIESQIYAANNFVKYLNPNGLLIIEDVPSAALDTLLSNINHDLNVTVLNYSNDRPRWDDILVLINSNN